MKAAAVLCASLVCSQATIARDYANWMAELPDNLYVTQVSIPGTHDTATASVTGATAVNSQCQTATIQQQLEAGVRVLDLRPGRALISSTIYCYHGTTPTSVKFEDALTTIKNFLDAHPTEFIIIHIDGANNSDKISNDNYTTMFKNVGITSYLRDFKRSLTVGEMRKGIFIIKRWGDVKVDGQFAPTAYEWYGDDKWSELSAEERWRKQTGGKLETPYGTERAFLHVQDLANSNGRGGYDEKVKVVEQMLKHAQTLNATSDYSNIFVMNFCSGYNGSISQSSSYATNATKTNKKVVDYLKDHSGAPIGILMADFLVTDTHSGITGASGTYTTYGKQFIEAVVDNNFTYAAAYATANAGQLPSFTKMTLPDGASSQLFHGNTVMIDVNKNGAYEVIAAGRDLGNGWANTITQISDLSTATQICQENISFERQITPYDHNNDGHIDILMANSWGSQLYLNDKAGAFKWLDAKDDKGDSRALLYGQELGGSGDGAGENQRTGLCIPFDVDFNGYKDIVTYSADKKQPVVFENYNGTDAIYGKGACDIPALTDGSMAEGDFNNDGRSDIIITGKNASGQRQISICLAKKGEWAFDVITPESLQGYATTDGAIKVADVNNDGLLDIFITGIASDTQSRFHYNVAYLLLNKGNNVFEKAPANFPGAKVSDIDFCDLNNDGLIDIVYLGEGPSHEDWLKVQGTEVNIYIAMNQGNGLFRVAENPIEGARSGASVAVADITGGGFADIARMGYSGTCFAIYTNNGAKAAARAKLVTDNYENHDWQLFMGYDDSKNVYVRLDNPIENAGIRYNAFAVTKDGHQISAVPANVEQGTLLSANVDAATLNGKADVYFPGVKIDNLKRYGVQAILPNKKVIQIDREDDIPTGIEGIGAEVEDVNAPVEFYNLQGQRVVNPANGIFIRRQGNNVSKVRI